MIKKYLNSPIIALFIILVFSSFFGIYYLKLSIRNTNIQLESLALASSISSYTKRAEGHLLLYLLLNDKSDRDKFFKRMESLDKKVKEISIINNSSIDLYSYSMKKMLYLANKLIEIKVNNINSSPEQYHEETREFHELSSAIRKASIDYVIASPNQLKTESNKTLLYIEIIYILLLLTGVICIAMIVVLIKKRGDELVVAKINALALDKLSNTDGLTGIGNRRSFDSIFMIEWQRSIRDQTPIGLMLIDIDCFKLFNDKYGHLRGDDCLINVARTLDTCMQRPADSIWRFGGEEFIAILPDTDNAISVAENCRTTIEHLIIPHEASIVSDVVTVSIGVCVCIPERLSDPMQFIDCVDKALYQAKNTGRNKVCSDIMNNTKNIIEFSALKD